LCGYTLCFLGCFSLQMWKPYHLINPRQEIKCKCSKTCTIDQCNIVTIFMFKKTINFLHFEGFIHVDKIGKGETDIIEVNWRTMFHNSHNMLFFCLVLVMSFLIENFNFYAENYLEIYSGSTHRWRFVGLVYTYQDVHVLQYWQFNYITNMLYSNQ